MSASTIRSFAFLGFALASASALAAPSYSLINLGFVGVDPINSSNRAMALNDAGTVVGTSGYGAFTYSNGTMKAINSQDSLLALGVNGAGSVVGNIFHPQGEGGVFSGFIYKNGTITELPELQANSTAYGINAAGQVVGTSGNRAFFYENGSTHDLGSLGGSAEAYAVNSLGHAVGASLVGSQSHAVLFKDGLVQDLGSLAGFSTAYGINDLGQIVGSSGSNAFLYENGGMRSLGTLGGTTVARGINNAGWVVGSSGTPVGTSGFVYNGSQMFDLNSVVDATGAGWTIFDARGINASGQIAASARNAAGLTRPVLLTPNPVPEPASLLALAAGAIAVLRRRRKG